MNKNISISALGWGYCYVILIVSVLMGEVATMDTQYSLFLAQLVVLVTSSLALSHLAIHALFPNEPVLSRQSSHSEK